MKCHCGAKIEMPKPVFGASVTCSRCTSSYRCTRSGRNLQWFRLVVAENEARYKGALEAILRMTKGREMGMADVKPIRAITHGALHPSAPKR